MNTVRVPIEFGDPIKHFYRFSAFLPSNQEFGGLRCKDHHHSMRNRTNKSTDVKIHIKVVFTDIKEVEACYQQHEAIVSIKQTIANRQMFLLDQAREPSITL